MTAFISEQQVNGVLQQLGGTTAPVRRAGVREALTFFERYMPEKSGADRVSYLKAMDLSKPVAMVDLLPGEIVVAFRHHTADWGEFHTRAGSDPAKLGITLDDRQYRKFEVVQRCVALQSTTSAFMSMARGSGGALQLVIPQAFRFLRVTQRGTTTW
jgi:hypothetical protein